MVERIECDIVIVGAGMSGCLLALAIIKKSPALNILLIDDNDEKVDKGLHPGFDARSIALSAGSCELLAQLNLWDSLVKNGQPIEDIHISDRGHLGIVELEKSHFKQPFGYVVELQNIGQSLQKKLSLTAQIKRLYNSRITHIEKQRNNIVCELQNGPFIQAKLCIAADGANSKTATLLSIETTQNDYACSAIIANICCDKPHQNRAFERFTDAGPLALLPLSDNRYSLVWSVKNSELETILALNEQSFLDRLQIAFGYRAGIFRKAGRRDSYPLKLNTTDKPITHRGVAIGNAAHCLHPVMGQGFNLGMRDLSVLATVIAQADELGSFNMLNDYWQARKNDHHNTIKLTDAMVRLFSNNYLPLVIGRNIALQAIAILPSLGAPIVKQAKGQFTLFIKEEKS
ncbi:2-octaprenyl-6-methoxyphenyl hydroxylase [Psychromonas hadalis]|uniref:2-octaprenyl-6-methoxyphenyl hydroxylase n=1 Tax=Psychromonas hadalis TaxID=211669 RepID=UPI0003B58CE6|nr:2-octaprenyl-6-methoxyphenyl hydroxylase [Psychromonas hadalis]